MKLKVLVAAMIAGGLVAGAWAKGPAQKNDFSSIKKEFAAARNEVAPPATTTTGDDDSFGRTVHFLGLLGGGAVTLTDDCTPDPSSPPGVNDHCVVLNAQPAVTTFSFSNIGSIVIPAKSANSLFCHMQTPVAFTQFGKDRKSVV